MKLSAQAQAHLSRLLDERVFLFKGGYRKEDVLAEIAEVFASSGSFSEQIVTSSEVKRRCNLGHLHCVYRLTFRTVLIPALRVLVDAGRSMTTRELVDALPPHVGRMVSDYVAELRHWNLLTQPKLGVYLATAEARGFLSGRVAVAAWAWPKGEKLPEECQDGPKRFIDEMTDDHPRHDKARHVEAAIVKENQNA